LLAATDGDAEGLLGAPPANGFCAAEFYDLDPRHQTLGDLEFFAEETEKAGGAVLELGCGTGRIAVPLAERGYTVFGLDHSPAMLARFARRHAALAGETQGRITFWRGSMTAFALCRPVPLIIIPFRAFQSLTTPEEQSSCLDRARRALTPNGRFIVDVFRPYDRIADEWLQPPMVDWEIPLPDLSCAASPENPAPDAERGTAAATCLNATPSANPPPPGPKVRRLRRVQHRRTIDAQKQRIFVDLVYETWENGHRQSSAIEPLALAYFFPDQLVRLLEAAGFHVESLWGGYQRQPVSAGTELLAVCRAS
jgi:SAM-dependent methyltransferase